MMPNEKNNFPLALICTVASLIAFACGGGYEDSTPTLSDYSAALSPIFAPAFAGSFEDDLIAIDTSRWQAAYWSNGGYFLNSWHPNQLSFESNGLIIKLEADTAFLTNKSAVSGEYTTKKMYKYGLYKVRLKVSSTPGTISGFFTYTGPVEGTQHDEINIEIKGDDPTKMQVNYWNNDIQHPTLINLKFDASAAEHDYAFRWSEKGIQWYVDDRLVHEENGSHGPLPVTAGKIILNHWGAVNALPWSTDYIVSDTPSLMTVTRISFTSELPATRSADMKQRTTPPDDASI
jgi:beta-glucanase (GH16 family)